MADQRIYALFQDVSDAERAIGALQDRGITRDHIAVISRQAAEQDEAARVRTGFTRLSDTQGLDQGEPETSYAERPRTVSPVVLPTTSTPSSAIDTSDNVETVGKEGLTTTTPQDAAAGAAVGSGVGLVAGILLGAAALAVPGVGLVLAGGALATAMGAAAATAAAGAVAGGVAGYLRDMGMPEQAAQQVADRLHEGDYLLSIVADSSRYDDLKQLLLKYNAVGVDINVASVGPGFGDVGATSPVVPDLVTPPAPPVVTGEAVFVPPATAPSTPVVPVHAVQQEQAYNFGSIAPTSYRAPGTTPDEELARAETAEERDQNAVAVEQSRTTQRETRDAIT